MKTFKQLVTENKSGDELYEIKLKLAEWWKANSNNPEYKKIKGNLGVLFNKTLPLLDEAIDMVYENSTEE